MTAIRKKMVLVVEDDPLIRDYEVATLKRAGFEVLAATDGIEGSALFARNFHEMDLIVTDISMPGMTGLELAAFARKIRADVNIVIASGSIEKEQREAAMFIENSRFIPKPFAPQELLDAIAEVFSEESPSNAPIALASAEAEGSRMSL